jgi:hypothetical protein
MKASEYISLFGVISKNQPGWKNDPNVSVFDFLDSNPEYELSEYELERIYLAEIFSFSEFISYINDENEMTSFLRETFDNFRTNGGDPEYWLGTLLDEMELNPQLFPTIHRGLIEKNLLQWMENWRTILREGQDPANDAKSKKPNEPKLTHHQEAMYKHYIGELVTREKHKDSIFNKWSHWRQKENRITPNSYYDLKAKTQLKHMEAVRNRLISEDKKNEANQCQKDIDALSEKMAKPKTGY